MQPSIVSAAETRVLTKVAQIRALTAAEAAKRHPIHLEGVITYRAPEYLVTFFQDDTGGIFVWIQQSDADISTGSQVEVVGNTAPGDFAPSIEHARVHPIGRAALPIPASKTAADLLTGKEDSQWIAVKGIVHSVALEDQLPPDMRRGRPQLVLGIASGTEKFKARIKDFSPDIDYSRLVDSVVTVRGACGTLFNERRQLVGIQLFVPTLSQVTVNQAAPSDPYSLAPLSINSLMQFSAATISGRRMRVQGVVTLSEPGHRIYVQDASGGVAIESTQATNVVAGDLVDAVGFPTAGRYAPILQDGGFRVIGKGRLPKPLDLTAEASLSGDHDAELVTINGRLLDQSEQGEYRVFTMQVGTFTYTGRMRKQAVTQRIRAISNHSQLQMTGVWSVETDEYRRPTSYQVLLDAAEDIVILQQPSWWTGRRILALSGILVGIIVVGALWVAILRRRVEEKTETLRATLESTAEGILVVDSEGRITTCSQKLVAMWRLPDALLRAKEERAIFSAIVSQLDNPDAFLGGASRLSRKDDTPGDDVLETKDGRIFESHSEPQFVKGKEVGRVWGFRDVTERQRSQERLAARTAELDKANLEIQRLNDQLSAENSRMSAELQVTQRLQRMMLPRDEDLRQASGLDICGFMEPASEVGGDYYDVVAENGRVTIGIGDVTGHGLESGVLAIMVQTAIRTLLASGQCESRKFFEVLNRVVYDNAHRMNCDRNLTLSLLQFQDSVATISGQHEEVIVVRTDGALERHDTIDLGFPLGLETDISNLIAERRVPLGPGDVMVLYTDGITEALDKAGVPYGVERLAQMVQNKHDESVVHIREAVLNNLHEHVNGRGVVDDRTLLVIKSRAI